MLEMPRSTRVRTVHARLYLHFNANLSSKANTINLFFVELITSVRKQTKLLIAGAKWKQRDKNASSRVPRDIWQR